MARAGAFSITDVVIDAYDEKGRALGLLDTTAETVDAVNESIVTLSHRDPNNPGKEFLIQIDESKLVEGLYSSPRWRCSTYDWHADHLYTPSDGPGCHAFGSH